MTDDHEAICTNQAACPVCSISPLPGEPRALWLPRVGAMYRAAPSEWGPSVRPPLMIDATCDICGVVFRTIRAITCSTTCRNRKSNRQKRERRALLT